MILHKKRCALLVCVLSLFVSTLSYAVEKKITWTGRPFDITIPVGVERVVKFDAERIQVAFPTDLWGIASAESSQGIVQLRTTRPFENVRVRFRNKDNGKIYSVNVTAVAGETDMSPIVVVDEVPDELDDPLIDTAAKVPGDGAWPAQLPVELPPVSSVEVPPVELPEPEPVNHGITTLVRYAMQNVYAPERLIDELDDVSRISFDGVEREIRLVPGTSVKSRVLGQWKNNDRYITAVYLQNRTNQSIDLDPRNLTGRHFWQIAALMHSNLAPANTFGDTTTLVTISDKKWVEYSEWLR